MSKYVKLRCPHCRKAVSATITELFSIHICPICEGKLAIKAEVGKYSDADTHAGKLIKND